MPLTKERGKEIRDNYSTIEENKVCIERNLKQVGGSRTKIDGTNGLINESIKVFTGKSTQVHLTTQKKFIETIDANDKVVDFIRLFCGNKDINNNGKDRYHTDEIDVNILNETLEFFQNNSEKIIDTVVCNGEKISFVTIRDLKSGNIYSKTFDEIINVVKESKWVILRGGLHLKNKDNKTIFHFQREGKKNKNNRYNVLFHIHKNLFID